MTIPQQPDSDSLRDDVLRQVLEHRSSIWAYCLALTRDADAAEDLFQEAHLAYCRKASERNPNAPFLAWALTIVRYTYLIDRNSRHRRLQLHEPEMLEAAIADAHNNLGGRGDARLLALRECLERLTPDVRTAVTLRYTEQLSCDAIATRLSKNVDSIYKVLSRARARLARCIANRMDGEMT